MEGLRRKLSTKLSVNDSGDEKEWEVILSLAILKLGRRSAIYLTA